MPQPLPAAKPFNAPLYALKALGIATIIVGVVAVCTVKATTSYMDVHNVPPDLSIYRDTIHPI